MNNIRFFFYLCSFVLLTSCSSSFSEEKLQELNGYWEITKVELPDGTTKEFTVNGSIDFFEVNNAGQGKRFKVMPQFNGEYLTNQVSEDFVIQSQADTTWINYSTEFSSWKEQLIELSEKELVVKNQNDLIYTYKRPVPFTLK